MEKEKTKATSNKSKEAAKATNETTNIKKFIKEKVAELKQKLDGKKVLCAFSGGIDSAVTAALIHAAAPESLVCVFIDHGLMRKNEPEEIMRVFHEERGMNIIKVDASKRFLKALAHITEPEQKRKIIGEEFIRAFEAEAKRIGKVSFLAQGTIKSDVIESKVSGGKVVVKSHHNVGGLPDVVDFEEIIEPLRDLYKTEVRLVGKEIGLPDKIVNRQPFPGPGLGIRIIGSINRERLEVAREADHIFREEIAKAGLDKSIWQYFAVLTNARSVGVKNGKRAYNHTVALRAVHSTDAREADWARIPYDVLTVISERIVNEIENVNRVVYDITTKPPATIEWE